MWSDNRRISSRLEQGSGAVMHLHVAILLSAHLTDHIRYDALDQ